MPTQKYTRYRFAFCLLMVWAFCACTSTLIKPYEVRVKIGDQVGWSKKQLNDQQWDNHNGINGKQRFWLRFKINIDTSVLSSSELALLVTALGSYDAYWDGTLIGHSGKVGTSKSTEIPGRHVAYFPLADSLSSVGQHVLALRVSNFHTNASYSFFNIRVAPYEQLLRDPLVNATGMYVLAGIFLIVALYYFFLYVTNRQEIPFLLFGLICGLFFCLIMLEYAVTIWQYRYDYQTIRLELIGLVTFTIAFLVPWFLGMQFRLAYRNAYTGLVLLVLITIYIAFFRRYDLTAQLMSLTMWTASVGLVGYATAKRIKGSRIILIALLVSVIPTYFLHYDYSLFLNFGLVIISMLYLLTIRSKEIEQAYRQSLLLSERLKIDLLKKNIQPHFLMNTLTSLIDWIEESPKQGIVFIESLANEFELLSQMAEVRLVPISSEIELCKSHLSVMQFRKEIQYVWEDHGIDPNDTLPPALIHTALENGITHSLPQPDGTIKFILNFGRTTAFKQYQLQTLAINRTVTKPGQKGTGLHYMEARLTESYGNAWTLHSTATDYGWLTELKIYAHPDH